MKFVVLSLPGNKDENLFLFPDVLDTSSFVECVGGVRVGYNHSWERSWTKATIITEGNATPEILVNHSNQNYCSKYIHFEDDKTSHFVIFPKTIDHDRMFEALLMTNNDIVEWYDINATSAGFVSCLGTCYGESQTLDIQSKGKEDTTLLLSMM